MSHNKFSDYNDKIVIAYLACDMGKHWPYISAEWNIMLSDLLLFFQPTLSNGLCDSHLVYDIA